MCLMVGLSLLSFACSGKKDQAKKLAGLCKEATSQLETQSQQADDETLRLMLQNALTACSSACDQNDDPSCKALDSHLDKICGVNADMCAKLCAGVKSPSLKKGTCARAGKAP